MHACMHVYIYIYMNVELLSQEHRDKQTDKEPTIYRSQQCDTRSGLKAGGKIKGVVTVYNKTIKRKFFILSYHIVIKDV